MIRSASATCGRSSPWTPIQSWFLHRIGKAICATASAFLTDLSDRLVNRVQLSSDALAAYVEATEQAFGADVDYGQIVKAYEAEPIGPDATALPMSSARSDADRGQARTRPYLDELHRAPKPHNAHHHASVHPAHKRFQQEDREPQGGRGATLRAVQLLPASQDLRVTPAMAAGVDSRPWSIGDLVTETSN